MDNKDCSLCGRDLSNYNLDFSLEVVCDHCVMGRISGIKKLEKETGRKFRNTRGLNDYLEKQVAEEERKEIIQSRKERGWSQTRLALELDISRRLLNEFETGRGSLPVRAVDKLRELKMIKNEKRMITHAQADLVNRQVIDNKELQSTKKSSLRLCKDKDSPQEKRKGIEIIFFGEITDEEFEDLFEDAQV